MARYISSMNILVSVVVGALLVYLLATIIRPEKF